MYKHLERTLVEADLASLEKDWDFLKEAKFPIDIYRVRAAKLFNVTEDKVTPKQRHYAKTEMYSKIYSISNLLKILKEKA